MRQHARNGRLQLLALLGLAVCCQAGTDAVSLPSNTTSSCVPLTTTALYTDQPDSSPDNEVVILLNSSVPCYSFVPWQEPREPLSTGQGYFVVKGDDRGVAVIDTNFGFQQLQVPSGSNVRFENVKFIRTPMSSTQYSAAVRFRPTVFMTNVQGNLTLHKSFIVTNCPNLQSYTNYYMMVRLYIDMQSDYKTYMLVRSDPDLTWDISWTNITCDASYPDIRKQLTETVVATAEQLATTLSNFQDMGPGHITLARPLHLLDAAFETTPPGITKLSYATAITGEAQFNSSLDLGFAENFLRLVDGVPLNVSGVVLMNQCSSVFVPSVNSPIQLLTSAFLWGVQYNRAQRLVSFSGVTLVVSPQEVDSLLYTALLLAATSAPGSAFTSGGPLTALDQALRAFVSPTGLSVAVVEPQTVTFGGLLTTHSMWANVTVTTKVPDAQAAAGLQVQEPTRCPSIRTRTWTHLPLRHATSPSDVMQAMADAPRILAEVAVELDPLYGPHTLNSSAVIATVPLAILLHTNVSLANFFPTSTAARRAHARRMLLQDSGADTPATAPSSTPLPASGPLLVTSMVALMGPSPTVAVAESGNRPMVLQLGSEPLLQLAPQATLLVSGLVVDATAGGSGLPAIVTSRPGQLLLSNVTLLASLPDFSALYLAADSARQGRDWRATLQGLGTQQALGLAQAGSSQGLDAFTVSSLGPRAVTLSSLSGWGYNATNLQVLLDPSAPTPTWDASPSPAPPTAVGPADGTTGGDASPVDSSGSSGSSSKGWLVAAVVVPCVCGVLAIAVAVLLLVRRHRVKASDGSLSSRNSKSNGSLDPKALPGTAPGTAPTSKDRPTSGTSGTAVAAAGERRSEDEDGRKMHGSSSGTKGSGSGTGTAAKKGGSRSNPYEGSTASTSLQRSQPDPLQEVRQLITGLNANGDKLLIQEQIGKGGYGTVYKGRWRNLDVAVKTILFTDYAEADACGEGAGPKLDDKQRALLEAAVCTALVHPNVVTTYHYDIMSTERGLGKGLKGLEISDSARGEYKLYLVQEYCDLALSAALNRKLMHVENRPCLNLILRLLDDISTGMAFIHTHNIIHGDLKPDNVLLKTVKVEGDMTVVAKVTDFGLCATIDPRQTHVSNITKGTPYYVAPEVVRRNQATPASDVYSFGVLMWEMYTCWTPWVYTATGGYKRHPMFKRWPRWCPEQYAQLALQCMSHTPAKRPTFTDITDLIHEMIEGLNEGGLDDTGSEGEAGSPTEAGASTQPQPAGGAGAAGQEPGAPGAQGVAPVPDVATNATLPTVTGVMSAMRDVLETADASEVESMPEVQAPLIEPGGRSGDRLTQAIVSLKLDSPRSDEW